MYIFEQVSVHVLKQNYFLACSWLEVSQISNTFEQLGFKLEMNRWGVEICRKPSDTNKMDNKTAEMACTANAKTCHFLFSRLIHHTVCCAQRRMSQFLNTM